MSINKDGPAFPCLERGLNGLDLTDHGMSLRDYFAAKAMQAFLNDAGWKADQGWFFEIAKGAYQMADAMLKAREEK